MTSTIEPLIHQLADILKKHQWKLVTAESCTAGGLAYALTSLASSSTWFERGYITYSNISKEELLGVNSSTLETHGAVSEQTAREMATGALQNSQAQLSIAITGIAGPDGGTPDKPVGTVWFAWASLDGSIHTYRVVFSGNRSQIREQSVEKALRLLLDCLS